MTPDENLEFRVIGTENDAAPCENCSHDYLHHVTLYGVSIPCDEEIEKNIQTTGYAEMDVMVFCGCTEYIPAERGEENV